MIEVAVFWTFASLVVLAALAVVLPGLGKSPIHGALALIGGFFCLAGLYVLLAAHLVATVQVIVYQQRKNLILRAACLTFSIVPLILLCWP